jgi:hypothetical protein
MVTSSQRQLQRCESQRHVSTRLDGLHVCFVHRGLQTCSLGVLSHSEYHCLALYFLDEAPSLRQAAAVTCRQIEDFFTKLIQRVAPKSDAQARGEVVVTRRFLENFSGDQASASSCAARTHGRVPFRGAMPLRGLSEHWFLRTLCCCCTTEYFQGCFQRHAAVVYWLGHAQHMHSVIGRVTA